MVNVRSTVYVLGATDGIKILLFDKNFHNLILTKKEPFISKKIIRTNCWHFLYFKMWEYQEHGYKNHYL